MTTKPDSATRILVRRLGTNAIHYATPAPGQVYPATVFGAAVEALTPPVATLCRVVLRGKGIIRMRDDGTDKHVCRACRRCAC